MLNRRLTALMTVGMTALTSGCGGESGNSGSMATAPGAVAGAPAAGATATPSPSPTPSPTATPSPMASAGCAADTLGVPSTSSAANVNYASYLGGGTADAVQAVQVGADCSLYIGGQITGYGGPARNLVAGTGDTATGILVRAVQLGASTTAAVRFGTTITDAQINPVTGDIAIASDAGIAVVSGDLATTRWTYAGKFVRVSIGRDGAVAAIGGASGKELHVLRADGSLRFTRSFGDSAVNDVAIMSSAGTSEPRIIVTGMAQRDGGGCSQLQVAWIRAYSNDNAQVWRGYDWTHAEAFARDSSCADTRGYRVEIGQDQKLYFAGESAGGNTVYRYTAASLTANAPNVGTDAYNQAYNTASNHITYFARFDPVSGTQEIGGFLLARLSSGRGNTIRPRAITADAAGNIYVGGSSAASIANRSTMTINGAAIEAYAGSDPWLLVVSPDLRTRRLWISFADGGQGEVRAIGAVNGTLVAGGQASARSSTTGRALYTTSTGRTEYTGAKAGHFAVLPAWR